MAEKSPSLRKTKRVTLGRNTQYREFYTLFNMNGPDLRWTALTGMLKKPNCRYDLTYNLVRNL